MATIAELWIPAADAGFGLAFERVPALTCELERVVADADFGVWLSGADRETIEAALEADPTVEAYELVASAEDEAEAESEARWLYTIESPEPIAALLAVIAAEGGTVLTASGVDGQWTVRLRFADREGVRRVHDELRARGVDADLRQIYEMTEETPTELGLTKEHPF